MSFKLDIQVLPEDYRYPANGVIVSLPDGTQIVLGTADSHAEASEIVNNTHLGSS